MNTNRIDSNAPQAVEFFISVAGSSSGRDSPAPNQRPSAASVVVVDAPAGPHDDQYARGIASPRALASDFDLASCFCTPERSGGRGLGLSDSAFVRPVGSRSSSPMPSGYFGVSSGSFVENDPVPSNGAKQDPQGDALSMLAPTEPDALGDNTGPVGQLPQSASCYGFNDPSGTIIFGSPDSIGSVASDEPRVVTGAFQQPGRRVPTVRAHASAFSSSSAFDMVRGYSLRASADDVVYHCSRNPHFTADDDNDTRDAKIRRTVQQISSSGARFDRRCIKICKYITGEDSSYSEEEGFTIEACDAALRDPRITSIMGEWFPREIAKLLPAPMDLDQSGGWDVIFKAIRQLTRIVMQDEDGVMHPMATISSMVAPVQPLMPLLANAMNRSAVGFDPIVFFARAEGKEVRVSNFDTLVDWYADESKWSTVGALPFWQTNLGRFAYVLLNNLASVDGVISPFYKLMFAVWVIHNLSTAGNETAIENLVDDINACIEQDSPSSSSSSSRD